MPSKTRKVRLPSYKQLFIEKLQLLSNICRKVQQDVDRKDGEKAQMALGQGVRDCKIVIRRMEVIDIEMEDIIDQEIIDDLDKMIFDCDDEVGFLAKKYG